MLDVLFCLFSILLQIPAKSGRDAKMIQTVASLIRAKSKLLLLESPDTVEIYKVSHVNSGVRLFFIHAIITTKFSNTYRKVGFFFSCMIF